MFLCFFVFVIGNIFGKTLKKLNPFIMLLGIIIFAPAILSILGWDKWYSTVALIVGVLSVFRNPFKFLESVWTEITMGFQHEKAKRQAKVDQDEDDNHVNDDLHGQKSESEDEEKIRRQAEELRRQQEAFKQEQARAYKEQAKRQEANQKSKFDPSQLSDAYKILGVAPGLSLEEYRKAWRELVQQYHPDKTAHLGEELQKLAHEKTQILNRAFETVKKSC